MSGHPRLLTTPLIIVLLFLYNRELLLLLVVIYDHLLAKRGRSGVSLGVLGGGGSAHDYLGRGG